MLSAVKGIRDRLIDRHRDRMRRRICLLTEYYSIDDGTILVLHQIFFEPYLVIAFRAKSRKSVFYFGSCASDVRTEEDCKG